MKAFCISDFSALIGIDWADLKHDVCELVIGNDPPVHLSTIASRPEAIHKWVMGLRMHHENKPIAVACELKKGPLIYALLKYEFITIFPLHPATVAKMRKAFHPSGAKSDPADAQLQAELLRDYMHKLTPIVPDSPAVRALAQLVECRRKLVQDRVDLTNSLTYYLKNYFPQVLDWFNEKDSHVFCDFIAKWPSLEGATGINRVY